MSRTEPTTMEYPLGTVTRSHHIAVSVADLEASIRWYEEKLGCQVTDRMKFEDLKTNVAFVTVNSFTFELVELHGSSQNPHAGGTPPEFASIQGPIHMAFTVDSCDASTEELKRRGVKFVWEPADYPLLRVRCSHFLDLEGNMLELVEHLG
ncbi:VOC family protein [Peribacillus cavernae]|uniref:VOC family protein n=1 Tax=Peribacillus cavernae TaxID=1674310 RepID=A0A3S0W532_9BACI|nr:VOC family protein [Peribacillus cavernae]MDQ0218039.1 catechol 2,3-dioxygenase-like lactoylglutathione lyase family enzyme [Peribacillus cavernae]RUQ32796.1 VOC family protein [Peribacillus cavernae]